jgi:hypothetical protein
MVQDVDFNRSDDSTQSSQTTLGMTATTLEARDFSPSPSLDDSDPSSRTNQRESILGVKAAAVHGPTQNLAITHLATGPPTHDKKRTGEIWMANVITTWLQQWLNLWKIRNEDRHRRDDDTRRLARDNQTIREVVVSYDEHATRITPALQWLF